jgi:hypothetical protein
MTLTKRWRWLIERITGWWYRVRVRRGQATMGRQVRYRVTTDLVLQRADGSRWRHDPTTDTWKAL